MRLVLHSVLVAWVSNRHWMAWNLFLAAVPALLAHRLFRDRRRPTVLWWVALAVFALFLPNAPYVISDLVHLRGNVVESPTRSAVLFGFLPSYAAYMLVGVTSYAYCLHRIRRWLGARSFDPGWVTLEIGIDLAAAVGVFLGRVGRLNSWDAFIHPRNTVWTSLETLSRPSSMVAVVIFGAFLFGVCRVLSAAGWLARMAVGPFAQPRRAA